MSEKDTFQTTSGHIGDINFISSAGPDMYPGPEKLKEWSDIVNGRTPPDQGCQFKRRWFNKYECRHCGYPSGWHHG